MGALTISQFALVLTSNKTSKLFTMTNFKPPKPELKEYLNQDKLKEICSTHSSETILEFVSMKIAAYDANILEYYEDKMIQKSPTISEECKKLNRDLRDLGL